MSPFVTSLPVEVDRLKQLLPKGSHIEEISFDKTTQELQMRWSNPQLVTPYTFPLPFSADQLEKKELPQGVTHRKPDAKPAKTVAA